MMHKYILEAHDQYNLLVEGPDAARIANDLMTAIDWFDIGRQASDDFCKTSPGSCKGNLGIPRIEMPQIKGSALSGFLKALKEAGIKVKKGKTNVAKLKATQKEINTDKASNIANKIIKGTFDMNKEPVLVSKEGHILDGHHRWAGGLLANLWKGIKVEMPTLTIDLPIRDLIARATNFEGVSFAGFKQAGWTSRDLTASPIIPEGFRMITNPRDLPESPWRYFKRTPDALLIPTSKLQTIRARPKGIRNALMYMWLTFNGKNGRRDPIDLQANKDGTYTVLDGNSTTAVAKKAGWKHIVGRILSGVTASEQERKQHRHVADSRFIAIRCLEDRDE